MKKFMGLIVFLIMITAWGHTADAGYHWEKVGMDADLTLYQQDGSLFYFADNNLYRSLDEGKTYNIVSKIPIKHVQIADDNSLYTLQGTTESDLAIYKFSPEPANWEKICNVPRNTKIFAVLPNGNILITKPYESSSLHQILLTKNNGLSWDDTAFNRGGHLFEPTPDGTVFTIEKETSFGARSTDFGATWKNLNKSYELNKFFVSPAYPTDNTVFAVINNKSIYRTTDGGDSWVKSMSGTKDNETIVSVAFSPYYSNDKTIYAADKDGRIFVSRDRGNEWNSLDIKLNNNVKLNNIVALSSKQIFAGTSNGIYEIIYTTPSVNYQTVTARFKIGQMMYKINQDSWLMDVAPYIMNGRTFIPVRYLAYALGINDSGIQWNATANEVTITKNDITVKLTPSKGVLMSNDKPIVMDVLPQINRGRMMLPARWVAEAFGADVSWNDSEQATIIQYQVANNTN